ncbi:MAG: biotin--[acetyl-CoA-carboxylase] ligase [Bacillota bacterium]|nr:biotin--[acetyl-CoA-carboxylase] ligase [Bacillota bacterium]
MENIFKNNIIRLKEVDSTNLEAFRHASTCAVVADCQTAGKGRMGRTFVSENNQGLWLSILETDILSSELTAWAGVVICKILRKHGLEAQIKWPNDIQVNGKKICGILCEMKNQAVVIGIGINLYQEDFKDLNSIATSAKLCNIFIDKEILLSEVLDGLNQMLLDYPSKKEVYLQYFKEKCNTLNQEIAIQIEGDVKKGIAKDIDNNFRLIIELSDGSIVTKDSGQCLTLGNP